MSLTPKDLRDVEAASARERAHCDINVRLGVPVTACYCTSCRQDRETIARHTPEIMDLLRGWMRCHVRGDACGGMG